MADFALPKPASLWDELDAACREHGIVGPDDFARRLGVHPTTINPVDALSLVRLPAWVFDVWLPFAGVQGSCVYIPSVVATYGSILGVVQRDGETPQAFTERLRIVWQERSKQ